MAIQKENLAPLTEDDVKVQYCDGADCMHDCPPFGHGDNCGSLLSPEK